MNLRNNNYNIGFEKCAYNIYSKKDENMYVTLVGYLLSMPWYDSSQYAIKENA